jgi:hypothetical protein
MDSVEEVKSVRKLFILLLKKKLFTRTDVSLMQHLLKQAGCQDLCEKCIQYANEQKDSSSFEKSTGIICINFA